MIKIKSQQQIKVMAESGKILKEILDQLASVVRPGIATEEIDKLARELVLSWQKKLPKAEIKSSFFNYRGYPAFTCVSINDEVVHGLPSDREIKEGDIVGLDFVIKFKALDVGIEEARVGNTTGDIGFAVQKYVEKNGFSVVRELVGHGVGGELHEEPYVPNYGRKGQGETLKEGMTIAIEPMVNIGSYEVVIAKDGTTYKTKDGSLSAHFEHTVAITKDGPEILT